MGVCVKKSVGSNPSAKKSEHVFSGKSPTAAELSVRYTECYNCGESAPSRMRCFSEQAWSVLLLWNEIGPSTVEKPICDCCYSELRTILMERMDEFDQEVATLSSRV